jgi:Caspase domain
MRAKSSTQNHRSTTLLAALTLVLAAAGLLVWSPNQDSHAQEPNRQLVQSGSPNQGASKRIALVIGNGAYTKAPPLKNPPNDARDMAATLRTLGFDVTSGINTNQRDMKRLIREFGQKLKNGGSGLFYYAGHGVQSKGRNYLVPVDADIQSEAEVEDSGVDASLVLNYMDDAQNGLNIVILDACRNNPFARSFRSASEGLAQVDAPTGTLIAYATAPGRVASDGTGQNGLYTSELLKQMRVPGLSATEMFMRVRAEVMKQTGNKQVPWEASSLVGSFYFSGSKNDGTTALPANEVKVDPLAFELSYWETIKNSQNGDDFKAYLEKYPNGQFVSLAKNRINSLDAPAKAAESRTAPADSSATELAFWDSIKNSNNAGDYRAYLEKYPNGDFVTLARNRLAPLEAAERSATEPARQGKAFTGYFGVMAAAGFDARPGQLTISPAGIQFIWDKGIEGIIGSRTDGLSGSRPVRHLRQPDPKPHELQCSNFTQAETEGFFIREIGQIRFRFDVIGWNGSIGRFRASSPADAVAALAAVREACKSQPK